MLPDTFEPVTRLLEGQSTLPQSMDDALLGEAARWTRFEGEGVPDWERLRGLEWEEGERALRAYVSDVLVREAPPQEIRGLCLHLFYPASGASHRQVGLALSGSRRERAAAGGGRSGSWCYGASAEWRRSAAPSTIPPTRTPRSTTPA